VLTKSRSYDYDPQIFVASEVVECKRRLLSACHQVRLPPSEYTEPPSQVFPCAESLGAGTCGGRCRVLTKSRSYDYDPQIFVASEVVECKRIAGAKALHR
jgi:hypothetical protein